MSTWSAQTTNAQVYVPNIATKVTTPLVSAAWYDLLLNYPSPPVVQFFMRGLLYGFHIGFDYSTTVLQSAKNNMHSALEHPHVVQEYLRKEVIEGRVAGPFRRELLPMAHISRFGVIPKSHQPNKWRLILDLSFPKDHSVNAGISTDLCSLTYVTIENAIQRILSLGPHSLLAKIDIQSAFRLIPVHPTDRHLLAMQWDNYIFIDTCLPFGLRSAPKLFNIMADLLAWILQEHGVSYIIHYLDEFLTIGPPNSTECYHNLNPIIRVCKVLGVPLAIDKVSGPSTTLEFLGIILDTSKMEARLPAEKLARTQQTVTEWLDKRNAKKREILSLVGVLQHAAKVVPSGRTFVSRMYATAAKVEELDFYTRLNKGFQSDLWWWHTFLQLWNGKSFLQMLTQPWPQVFIQTDASGSWGCGAFYNGRWLQWQWPEDWHQLAPIDWHRKTGTKELAPIVLACAVWGNDLSQKAVQFQCDNAAVVAALKKGSAKDEFVMHLLRSMWFFTAFYNIN